ncbi:Glycogenin-2 [Merluccius polli]|uniref:glycogenin glucosyltransferase n=1 Tax=Merluccius polli TaxID=89951 RepID=A0AA47N8M7_MERPO|nr:Glycogenin-2 [Merluccius polli]
MAFAFTWAGRQGFGQAGRQADRRRSQDVVTSGIWDAVTHRIPNAGARDNTEAGAGQIAGIASAVGMAILGAASSYFAYQKKKLCFKLQGAWLEDMDTRVRLSAEDTPPLKRTRGPLGAESSQGADPESGKNYQGDQAQPQLSLTLFISHTSPVDEAFVTLATTDGYCMGATVVAQSLRRHGTSRRIVVMISPGVSDESRCALQQVFDEVVRVDVLDSGDRAGLARLGRPELGVTFTKLHAWTLMRYRKCVFLDADTLVLQNVDELFDREELSAAPDPGWPDCFNTGVFVYRPSLDTHARLLEHAQRHGSFDGGDQGLLNAFFSDWAVSDINRHLPFVYNLSASTVYTYLPAFQRYGHDARIVHFLGPLKPWLSGSGRQRRDAGVERFVALWWKEFLQHRAPAPPGTTQQLTQQRQTRTGEAEIPFRAKFDFSGSLLAHFSPADRHQSHRPPPEDVTEEETEEEETEKETEEETEEETGKDPCLAAEGPEEPEAGGVSVKPSAAAAEAEAQHLERRRQQWEAGRVDYLGRDAFQHIQRKLDSFLR